MEKKDCRLSDVLYRLRSRAATTRGAHKETQTPSPCESTLAVEYGGYDLLLLSPPVNSSVARHRVSLSSGIRMFARESETRVVYLNHCFCCRAGSRIPNHT